MKHFTFILILILALVNINSQKKELTVEDIYSGRIFSAPGIRGVIWIDNGNKYSFLKSDPETKTVSIFTHDVLSGEEKILVPGTALKENEDDKPFIIQNYKWSTDERYILFTGVLPARSLKTGGAFYIYDLKDKKFFLLADSEEPQSIAQFSPDGKMLGFVRSNNLFVIDIETKTETQLTFDGNDLILNGIFDWVYEEEFSIINGWQWSPDSRNIAFWQLDQSDVPEIKIAKWDSLHLNFHDMRYPKAGDKNSKVKIGVVNISTAKTNWMDIGSEEDIYIPRINFTHNPEILSIQRLNRLQNKLELLLVDVNAGKSNIILTETDDAWVDVHDDLFFLKNGKEFIWSSEKDGYNHFYLYSLDGKLINQITKGNFDVKSMHGIDEENRILYYSSSEVHPSVTDLYSINLDGKNKKRITEKRGTNSVDLSINNKYFINRFSNSSSLTSTQLFNSDGSLIRELTTPDNSFFEDYGLSPVEFLSFTTSDGVELNSYIIKPSNFDASKKYPVLIYNYSGPGSQVVVDRYGGANFLWHQMLAQKGYIIFAVDNRGTGARGRDFKKVTYKNLGYWEAHDHIEAAKYLLSLGYVDKDRIGIWGWSYGGYMALLTLFKGADYFKAGVSVAPVTHWKFYDTIYTERFMQTPQLNPEGYEESSPLTYIKDFKGKLLLIHGTADDNVHFQNAVVMVDELIKNNKQFETMFYPEKDHGIFGGNTRIHLFNMITNFILNNL